MKLLMRKDTTELMFDWQDDPTLAAAREQLAALEEKLATAGREVSEAERVWYTSRETFEDALLDELLERATPNDVERAKKACELAQAAYERVKAQTAPLTRARERLSQELAPLEAAAKQRALSRLMEDYKSKVRALSEILTQAERVNAEVAHCYRAMKDCAPEREPWAVPEVSLAWPELTYREHAQDGGKLGHWRIRAKEVLNGS